MRQRAEYIREVLLLADSYSQANDVPKLNEQDYERLCNGCRLVAESSNLQIKFLFYKSLLEAMYRSEHYGEENHFTKLQEYFLALDPDSCRRIEDQLKAAVFKSRFSGPAA